MSTPGVVVVLRDGMVSKVYADDPVNVYIVDMDADDESHPHWVATRQATVWKEEPTMDGYAVHDVAREWETC